MLLPPRLLAAGHCPQPGLLPRLACCSRRARTSARLPLSRLLPWLRGARRQAQLLKPQPLLLRLPQLCPQALNLLAQPFLCAGLQAVGAEVLGLRQQRRAGRLRLQMGRVNRGVVRGDLEVNADAAAIKQQFSRISYNLQTADGRVRKGPQCSSADSACAPPQTQAAHLVRRRGGPLLVRAPRLLHSYELLQQREGSSSRACSNTAGIACEVMVGSHGIQKRTLQVWAGQHRVDEKACG